MGTDYSQPMTGTELASMATAEDAHHWITRKIAEGVPPMSVAELVPFKYIGPLLTEVITADLNKFLRGSDQAVTLSFAANTSSSPRVNPQSPSTLLSGQP
jgi:hypothetical protein